MSIIDAIIILVLLAGAVLGFKKGAIRSLVALIGTVIVVVISYYLKNPIASLLLKFCPFLKFSGMWEGLVTLNILLYEAIAYLLVFLVLSSILALIIKLSKALETILNATIILGIPSKIIGAVLGFLEAVVFCFLAIFVLLQFNVTNKMVIESSLAMSIVSKTPFIGDMVNDTYKAINNIHELQEKYKDSQDKDAYNGEILKTMLEYKVITKEEALNLVESKKLEFNGVKDIINNYEEEK